LGRTLRTELAARSSGREDQCVGAAAGLSTAVASVTAAVAALAAAA
jgi:hypothetical protein